MNNFIFPITTANFETNWKIANSVFLKSEKKYTAFRIASFFCNTIFTFLSVLAVNGLLHDHSTVQFRLFLEGIPLLIPLWERWRSLVLSSTQSFGVQLGATALSLYIACFVIGGIISLLVMLFYRSDSKELPVDSRKENAAKLLALAKDARYHSNRIRSVNHPFYALFFVAFQLILLSLYSIIEIGSAAKLIDICTAPIMQGLVPLIHTELTYISIQTAIFVPSLIIFTLLLYLSYSFALMLLSVCLQPFYYCNVPYRFVAEAEHHYVFADTNFEGMSDEEIKAVVASQAESHFQQAMVLEASESYKKAKDYFALAAHGGNAAGMEHYARHWLITRAKDPAKYWLQKCVASGNASKTAKKMLRRLSWHRKVSVRYIKK